MDRLLAKLRRDVQELRPLPTGVEPKLTRLSGIRAVMFDVYGTLLISGSGDVGTVAAAPADAFVDACRASGLELTISGQEATGAFVAAIKASHAESRQRGIEYPEVDIVNIWQCVLDHLKQGDATDGSVENVDLQSLAIEYETRVNPVWPMPGLDECLAALQGAGMTLGIVSNAQFFTPLLFPAFLGQPLTGWGFKDEFCIWSYQHGHAKPGLSLYQRAAELLERSGIRPSEVLYVGNDMLNDVMPAKQMGFRTALFAGDHRSLRWREGDQRVAGVEADLIMTELGQLLACVGITESLKRSDD